MHGSRIPSLRLPLLKGLSSIVDRAERAKLLTLALGISGALVALGVLVVLIATLHDADHQAEQRMHLRAQMDLANVMLQQAVEGYEKENLTRETMVRRLSLTVERINEGLGSFDAAERWPTRFLLLDEGGTLLAGDPAVTFETSPRAPTAGEAAFSNETFHRQLAEVAGSHEAGGFLVYPPPAAGARGNFSGVLSHAVGIPCLRVVLAAVIDRQQSSVMLANARWRLVLLAISGYLLLFLTGWYYLRNLRARTRAIARAAREREAAHAREQQREAQLSTLVQHAPIVWWAINCEGVFTVSRGRGLAVIGLEEDQVVGQSIWMVYKSHPAILQAARNALQGESEHTHVEHLGRYFETTWEPLRDADGNITGATGVAVDLTARRAAEEALRRNKRLLERTQQLGGIGGWSVDAATREVHWSSEVFRIHGLPDQTHAPTLETAIGYYTSEYQPLIREAIEECLRTGAPYEGELQLLNARGTLVWVHVRGEAEREGGRIVRVWGTISDISERKQLEAKLLRAQKLESLEDLAAGVAHDFNNILLGISGHADVSLEQRDLPAPVRHALQTIIDNSHRASDLCRQLLAYAGRGETRLEPVQLTKLIHSMKRLIELEAGQRCAVRYELTPGVPVVLADRKQLQQVVLNLVRNAAEAVTPEANEIVLRSYAEYYTQEGMRENVIEGAHGEGEYVMFEVRDAGHGIPAHAQHRIFDPFYSSRFAGRGLGLAAVHGIVRAHEGLLFLDSRAGHGTTFRVGWPVAARGFQTEFSGTDAPAPGERLLVVSEDSSAAHALRRALKPLGLDAIIVDDEGEATELMEHRPQYVSAMLIDLCGNDAHGRECVTRLRVHLPDVPILLWCEEAGQAPGENELEPLIPLAKSSPPQELVAALSRLREAGNAPSRPG